MQPKHESDEPAEADTKRAKVDDDDAIGESATGHHVSGVTTWLTDAGEKRLPKRKKYALLMGYNGGGYKGMQINPHGRTIEAALLDGVSCATWLLWCDVMWCSAGAERADCRGTPSGPAQTELHALRPHRQGCPRRPPGDTALHHIYFIDVWCRL